MMTANLAAIAGRILTELELAPRDVQELEVLPHVVTATHIHRDDAGAIVCNEHGAALVETAWEHTPELRALALELCAELGLVDVVAVAGVTLSAVDGISVELRWPGTFRVS